MGTPKEALMSNKGTQQREIKFRAWHKARKIMYRVADMSWYTDIGLIADPSFEYAEIQDEPSRCKMLGRDIELMQYTGLHDKNGREGWHKDIAEDKHGIRWLIEWDDERGRFTLISLNVLRNGENHAMRERDKQRDMVFMRKMEVIGNVYENPELLEVQS